MKYETREFNLPTGQAGLPKLDGISDKQIEVHLGLYKGYVTHVNKLHDQIAELTATDANKYAYAITETRRRLGFEFNGMRMHEYYFEQFDNGPKAIGQGLPLTTSLADKYGSWDGFIAHFKEVAMSRGIGWTVLYWDQIGNTPHVAWVTDHELGTLAGLPIILALDMWEHAFMVDYTPTEKAQYIDAFLSNVNWELVSTRYDKANK